MSNINYQIATQSAELSSLVYKPLDIIQKTLGNDLIDYIKVKNIEVLICCVNENIFIVFAGTNDFKDWRTDFNIRPVFKYGYCLHQGFSVGFDSVEKKIIQALSNYCLVGKNIITAGHSMGGALALIAAAQLNGVFLYDKNNKACQLTIVNCYSFAAPKVGDRIFSWFCGCEGINHYRFVNNGDLVPYFPMLYYKHYGQLYYLWPNGKCYTPNILFRVILFFINRLIYMRWFGSFKHHAIQTYIERIRKWEL